MDEGAEVSVGMYEIGNPTYPQVRVGQFVICRQDDKSVWIAHDDGEGGQFKDALFEAALLEFWHKHF